MKIRSKVSPGIVLPGVLAIGSITGIMAIAVISIITNNSTNNASALTYSSNTDVSFTFNPTLSISLSDTNINIDNLLPGLSSESSPITVSVNSNTPYGYSLFASVGNSTDYNTTSLTHEDSNIGNNAVFTSIATNASLPELNTDNTWGYTYRTHNTNNTDNEGWSNYNGLPLYSTVDNNTSTNNPALLIDTKNPADSTKSIDFKIAAKASSTQASGTYNNVINFYAVGKPEPVYMQDITSIKAKLKNEHDTLTAIDQRDGRKYTIAKLKDGKIWMTQNLDLAGGTKLYSETSDVAPGYSQSANRPYYTLPYSSISGFSNDAQAYVYNVPYDQADRTSCGQDHPCYSYYSWLAATAVSGKSLAAKDVDAPYSVCPKGWRLPNSRSTVEGNSDFYQLAIAYGMSRGVLSQTTNSFRQQAVGKNTVPNFTTSRGLTNGAMNYSDHIYWSSTSGDSNTYAMYMYFSTPRKTGMIGTTVSNGGRKAGAAVRCIIR